MSKIVENSQTHPKVLQENLLPLELDSKSPLYEFCRNNEGSEVGSKVDQEVGPIKEGQERSLSLEWQSRDRLQMCVS